MNLMNVIEKPSNLYIIAVEGLDATGKETFVNSLYNYIKEFDWGDSGLSVVQHAFPTYSTEIGKRIKNILMTPHEDRDNQMLDDLMFYDRIDYMIGLTIDARNHKGPMIVILDRYYFSNFVYSSQDSYTTQKRFELEALTLPKPNIVIHFIPESEEGRKIHEKQIEEKEEKDLNEVYDFQKYLMSKYIPKFKYSVGFYRDLDKKTAGHVTGDITIQMVNDVGSNYGNLNRESEIVSLFRSWAHQRELI